MGRSITSGFRTEATAGYCRPIFFFEGVFANGTVRLWSGFGDFSWNSQTWAGAGDFAGFSAIQETTDVRAVGVEFSLSGVPSTLVEIALAECRTGNAMKLWVGFLSTADGSLVADPYLTFLGRMDVPTIQEGADAATVVITAENRLVDLERSRERRYTLEDQKIDYPTDTGLRYVPSLQDQSIVWGRTG
jgi:hypothetical protein